MKKAVLCASVATLLLQACGNPTATPAAGTSTQNAEKKDTAAEKAVDMDMSNAGPHIQSVNIDQANVMLRSYLTSVDYQHNDTELHSWIFNADSLRNYLNDSAKGRIVNLKIMLAHTPNYIKNGGKDKNCGYRVGALTVVLTGYDDKNNYIYNKDGRVMEQAMPCPANCPTSGTASKDLLPK